MKPLTAGATAVLTSTTSSQTVTLPSGYNSLCAYNGGSNPVFLKIGASVAVPGATFDAGVICVQPGTTQVFGISPTGGTLAYIAQTAGGTLVLTVGEGA